MYFNKCHCFFLGDYDYGMEKIAKKKENIKLLR